MASPIGSKQVCFDLGLEEKNSQSKKPRGSIHESENKSPEETQKNTPKSKYLKTDLIDKKGSLIFKDSEPSQKKRREPDDSSQQKKEKKAIKSEYRQRDIKDTFLKKDEDGNVKPENEEDIFKELEKMPQKINDENVPGCPINIKEQYETLNEIRKNKIFTQPEIEIIQQNEFAPELIPVIKNPTEVQDLRKIGESDSKDIQEWVATAIDVLPEISQPEQSDEQKKNDRRNWREAD